MEFDVWITVIVMDNSKSKISSTKTDAWIVKG